MISQKAGLGCVVQAIASVTAASVTGTLGLGPSSHSPSFKIDIKQWFSFTICSLWKKSYLLGNKYFVFSPCYIAQDRHIQAQIPLRASAEPSSSAYAIVPSAFWQFSYQPFQAPGISAVPKPQQVHDCKMAYTFRGPWATKLVSFKKTQTPSA